MDTALKRIETPIVSVSEVRKNFADVVKKSEDVANAVYVFNNNQPAAVIMSPSVYERFTKEFDELKQYREASEKHI